jgi:predicted transcriptional regulator
VPNLVKIFREHLGYSAQELSKLLRVSETDLAELYPAEAEDRTRPKFTIVG